MTIEINSNITWGRVFLVSVQALLLILKLTGVVSWSWWIVWFPALLVIGLFILMVFIIFEFILGLFLFS